MYILNENSPVAKQPKACLTKLKWHQLTMIQAMLDAESKCEVTYETDLRFRKEVQRCHVVQRCNVGFLADRVSAGKTLTTLGLICSKQVPDQIPIPGYGGTVITNPAKPVRANLIIVPQGLVTQWQTFAKQTTLKVLCLPNRDSLDCFYDIMYSWEQPEKKYLAEECVSVKSKREALNYFSDLGMTVPKGVNTFWRTTLVNDERTNDILNNVDIVILAVSNYKFFQKISIDIKWARIFYDDAHQITGKFNEYASFYWIITATPTASLLEFAHINPNYAKVVYKNADDFVERQMSVPPPTVFMIKTGMDAAARAVSDMIPRDILAMINAGNVRGAAAQLNCGIDTKENILQAFTNSLHRRVQMLTDKINMLEKHQAMGVKNEGKITKLKADLEVNQERINDIKERLASIDSELCFICACEFENPAITECCKRVFCFLCLTTSIANTKKCPYCMQNPKYKLIGDSAPANAMQEFNKMGKIEAFIALLEALHNKKPDARIIVFSEQMDHCHSVCKTNSIRFKYEKFKGSRDHTDDLLKKYQSGKINILLADPKHYGSGHNIQMTDYVILLHRLDEGLEIQGIGRAQRYGRTSALKIVYLIDECESDRISYPNHTYLTRVEDIDQL